MRADRYRFSNTLLARKEFRRWLCLQTQYPADWAFRETKIDDSGGDIVIKRVLGFSPQGWKDAIFSS